VGGGDFNLLNFKNLCCFGAWTTRES
jgi:hypothetical protein